MRRRRLAVIAVALAALVLPATAGAAAPLRLGLFDYRPFTQADGASWSARAHDVGVQIIRVSISWSQIAPEARPAGFDAANPNDAAYRWGTLDAQLRAITAAGFDALVTVQGAPAWAEGPDRPRSARAGTWRPDPSELARFMTALAKRYSGEAVDSTGAPLPRIHLWQVWNEPNLSTYLTPQWETRGKRLAMASPALYRRMLNLSYSAIKAVQPDATVLAAGTAPYGDPAPGGNRIAPALFLRTMLCLKGKALTKTSCPDPTRLDAYDHHSYGVRAPTSPALNPDDAVTPDVHKLTRIMRRAVSVGTVRPRRSKPLWITELSYDSNPPDPQGVPANRHAAWLEQSFQLLWSQGARTILWFAIVDDPPVPDYATTYQAGLFLRDGTPKPAATAFAFPFVRHGNRVWGRAPATGPVIVERRTASGWRVLRRFVVRRHDVFDVPVKVGRSVRLRARQGTQTSLTWPVT